MNKSNFRITHPHLSTCGRANFQPTKYKIQMRRGLNKISHRGHMSVFSFFAGGIKNV